MGMQYRAWLPPAALDDGTTGRLLGEVVRTWSGKWFAAGTLQLLGETAAVRPADAAARAGEAWEDLGGGLALGVSAAATLGIAGMLLDVDLGGAALDEGDNLLVERLLAEVIKDLRTTLAEVLDLKTGAVRTGTHPPAWPGARTFSIGRADRGFVLNLVIAADRLVALRRSVLRPPPPAPHLSPVTRALEAQSIRLSARIGRCDLSLAELSALCEGDVLILDRPSVDPLDLVIDGDVKPGNCSVEQANEQLCLRMSNPLSG
jgi:flagellar motor switch/type III secretory pathway protein FliN